MDKNNQATFAGTYGYYFLAAIVLIALLSVALLSLRNGFSGDQALFLIYSKAIDGGAVYYKDVWDIKQPGIIFFYYLGGKLFGFTEVGIHLLEIIYWLGFSLLLIFGLRKYFTHPFLAAATPLFSIGIYYSVSGSIHLTQAEALACFPLFLSLWFGQKFLEHPERKSFLFWSGLSGGVVLSFKLLFAVLPGGFWLGLFLFLYFLRDEKKLKNYLVLTGLICSGILIPIVLIIIYFAVNSALADLWYTTFVYPSAAAATITMKGRWDTLTDGLVWFFKSYFPVISLTAFFIFLNTVWFFERRRKKQKIIFKQRQFIFGGLFLWVFLGLAAILIQRLSWWEYHYSLLMVPLGILALRGLDDLFEIVRNFTGRKLKAAICLVTVGAVALLFIPTARRFLHKVREFRQGELVEIASRKEVLITGAALEDYKSISADTAFLRKMNLKPTIYVVANPLFYYISGIRPVLASNGAMMDMFIGAEWDRLNREMAEKPPEYIFIDRKLFEAIVKKDSRFFDTIEKDYAVYQTVDRGKFYKRKN